MAKPSHEPMLEMFIFETAQLLEQLEQIIISSERTNAYSAEAIGEIFRIMHTIKGSSAMMLYNNISVLAHAIEDLFYFIREYQPATMDFTGLTDLVLKGADFIQRELTEIDHGRASQGNAAPLLEEIKDLLAMLKQANAATEASGSATDGSLAPAKQQYYISSDSGAGGGPKKAFKAVIFFEEDCQMENIRAFTLVHNLKDLVCDMNYCPANIVEDNSTEKIIREQGFQLSFRSEHDFNTIYETLMETIFLKHFELEEMADDEGMPARAKPTAIDLGEMPAPLLDKARPLQAPEAQAKALQQNIISVSVAKLDTLMDLVGEMVIAEAMVIQNPDLQGLELDNFQKAARQLNKITTEMQDMVMSIRMVPLSTTFHKMHRIARDMCRRLDKEVRLAIIGEETEVDKNIIEHISDPLMHLVRNALDHGIETVADRTAKGKEACGTITLEAKNAGSDVLILIKDDGRGLNQAKLLAKARDNNLLYKPEAEMTDREIFNLILHPGFSTKDSVTEFSGRGVGMDVVRKNIETVGGSVAVDSVLEEGTTVTLKIPLTLAIIDGMNIRVGHSCYTIPTVAIKESFRPEASEIITDPAGNEMILVRGQLYPILRLHRLYGIETGITAFTEGILIMVEQDGKAVCLFADELLGQQQVVVKALPNYIKNRKKIRGLAGCTLLGDGSISLILDIGGVLNGQI